MAVWLVIKLVILEELLDQIFQPWGSGVPFERIVTEVMWPTLQVKEGFSLTRLVTKNSQTLQGYEQASRDNEKNLAKRFCEWRDASNFKR